MSSESRVPEVEDPVSIFFSLLLLSIFFHRPNELSFVFLSHFSFIVPIQQKKHNFPLTSLILKIFRLPLDYNIPFYFEIKK